MAIQADPFYLCCLSLLPPLFLPLTRSMSFSLSLSLSLSLFLSMESSKCHLLHEATLHRQHNLQVTEPHLSDLKTLVAILHTSADRVRVRE